MQIKALYKGLSDGYRLLVEKNTHEKLMQTALNISENEDILAFILLISSLSFFLSFFPSCMVAQVNPPLPSKCAVCPIMGCGMFLIRHNLSGDPSAFNLLYYLWVQLFPRPMKKFKQIIYGVFWELHLSLNSCTTSYHVHCEQLNFY